MGTRQMRTWAAPRATLADEALFAFPLCRRGMGCRGSSSAWLEKICDLNLPSILRSSFTALHVKYEYSEEKKPFGPWTTHLPLVMAHSPMDLVQYIRLQSCSAIPTARVSSASRWDQTGSRTALLYLGIYCRAKDDYSQLMERLKDPKPFLATTDCYF